MSFCGAELEGIEANTMETVNSIEVALTNVIRNNGKDIILNARKLLSCLADYAPKLIKEILTSSRS